MNFKKIGIIIKREYLNRVKKKSFLVVTFIAPLLFALITALPTILMLSVDEKAYYMGVIDESGIVLPEFHDNESVQFKNLTGKNPDIVKSKLDSLGLQALLTISPIIPETESVNVALYSKEQVGVETIGMLKRAVNRAVESYRIKNTGVENLDKIIEGVKSNVGITTYTFTEEGDESLTVSGIYEGISMVLGIVVYMFIALFCGAVMGSIIEEKSSRVIEVMVSSVRPVELMIGKIVGVSCVAFTQFFLWIALTLALVFGITSFAGLNLSEIMQNDPSMQMTQMMGVDASQIEDASGMNVDMVSQMTNHDKLIEEIKNDKDTVAVLNTISSLPYTRLLLSFLVYFIFGYFLYASLFAAIGSSVEEIADAQQLQLPVTIPLLLGFFISFIAFKNPDSAVVFWGSMIPFTSPIVMMSRIPFGVPTWQLVLSIGLLIGTFVVISYFCARIYKVGILSYGKKASFKDLWKWMKQ